MTADSKQIIFDYYRKVWEEHDVDAIPTLFAESYVNHAGARGTLKGPDGILANYRSLKEAFPDVAFTLDLVLSEGSRVCAYYTMTGTHTGMFMGIAPTDNAVKVPGIGIYEVQNGMIAESWVVRDSLVLLRQLGADVTTKPA
ncbi:ester cyclase [Agrobacterium vitis]|uniref:ester cyclase n=1 Tax=Agrobacterium vitis TaxID=373 RepID=UPI0018D24929|nr:ester cyclase [Agrobacterium vitis]